MPSRPKLRLAAMWASTVLSLLLAALLVLSCFASFSFDRAGTIIMAADGPNGSTIIHKMYWIPIVAVNAGCLHVWRRDYLDIQSPWHVSASRTAPAIAWTFTQSSDPVRKERSLAIPLWAPLLLAALPVVLLRQTARARRRAGVCTACAYDRRGLPPTSPCPECGSK
jgi:hypothetical protein